NIRRYSTPARDALVLHYQGEPTYEDFEGDIVELSPLPPGEYKVWLAIDPCNEIAENDESNNSYELNQLQILPASKVKIDCPSQVADLLELRDEPISQGQSHHIGAGRFRCGCDYNTNSTVAPTREIIWADWHESEFIGISERWAGCDTRQVEEDDLFFRDDDRQYLVFRDREFIDYSEVRDARQGLLVALEENSVLKSDICGKTPACQTEETPAAPVTIELFDANPQFISLGFLGIAEVDSIEQLTDVAELVNATTSRRSAVTADGVTKVLLSIVTPEPINSVSIDLSSSLGAFTFPWGQSSHEIDEVHRVLAVYTAPEVLPTENRNSLEGILSSVIDIKINAQNEDEQPVVFDTQITLLQPPVVLVHGTFDNPENCWNTPLSQSGNSMVTELARRQIKVFTVDYSQSNGSNDVNLPFTEPTSSFESNKKVIYSNPGGIEDAVEYYRGELSAACTRADVVGHSLGGVLPRVYASDDDAFDRYNDDYYRSDNFQAGDINRLITISSTHHGSDLSYFQHFFSNAWEDSELPFLERLTNSALPISLWLTADIAETGAMRDQVPASQALRKIGPTPIPSHAIVATVEDHEKMLSHPGEEGLFDTYANRFKGITALLYFFRPLLRSYLLNAIRDHSRLPAHLQNGNELQSPFLPLSIATLMRARRPDHFNELLTSIDERFQSEWESWHLLMDDSDDDWYLEDRSDVLLQYETSE
ncbi:MAG: alpha/beta fold hydrolase, partial [Bacteroidota bacterium]